MSTASAFSEVLRHALGHPTRGVVGLVDDLLEVCRESGLQIEWQGNGCHARSRADDAAAWFEVSLRKSVFRTILARVAVLCNEHCPDSVSPYGGQGKLAVGTNPVTVL